MRSIRRATAFALALWLVTAWPALAQAPSTPVIQPAVTVEETGIDASGRRLYALSARSASIDEVLRALLDRSGAQYSIAQDVTGPISLQVREATLHELLDRVVEASRPPIRIVDGPVLRIVRGAPQASGGVRIASPADLAHGPGPLGSARNGALLRPVTLSIPDNRPVPIFQALAAIEQQTRVPIRLDSSIPPDVQFSARFVQAPLSFVLDSIAKTGALKWLLAADGTVVIVPSDHVRILLGNVEVARTPCVGCRHPLSTAWRFCPNCARATGRAAPARRAR